MRIKFIKPLPRIDHVIPAGQIIDAPEGFAKKMVQTGRAVWANAAAEPPVEPVAETPVEAPAEEPVEPVKEEPVAEEATEKEPEAPKKTRRKKA